MTKEERKTKMELISLFRDNKLGYLITLFSVISELCYTVAILDVIESDTKVFFVVMLNITMLFGIFYIAVLEQKYVAKASYVAVVLAIYILVRLFVLVPDILMPSDRNVFIALMNAITAVLLIAGAVITIDITRRREKHMVKESA